MPESKGRKKNDYTPPVPQSVNLGPSPRWWAPTMVTLMLAGLVWIVVFYLSQAQYPVASLGGWNVGIGIGVIMLGFLMTTRWR